ncbi:hypothetical protein [Priestia megaterium]|uniref:hypothetical protein n=1 Tax=Priestia megaterium TaxID=1404 RepID=UPI0021BF1027|nr:hypothetical protein [Priestia megaterium]
MSTHFQYQHLRAVPKSWSQKELHIQLNRIKHNSELSTIAADPLFLPVQAFKLNKKS